MRRLATDVRLRAVLGQSARKLWMERFTLEQMVSGYRDAIETACAAPFHGSATRTRLPGHFLTDGTEHTARLLRQMGLPDSRITEIWRGLAS